MGAQDSIDVKAVRCVETVVEVVPLDRCPGRLARVEEVEGLSAVGTVVIHEQRAVEPKVAVDVERGAGAIVKIPEVNVSLVSLRRNCDESSESSVLAFVALATRECVCSPSAEPPPVSALTSAALKSSLVPGPKSTPPLATKRPVFAWVAPEVSRNWLASFPWRSRAFIA